LSKNLSQNGGYFRSKPFEETTWYQVGPGRLTDIWITELFLNPSVDIPKSVISG